MVTAESLAIALGTVLFGAFCWALSEVYGGFKGRLSRLEERIDALEENFQDHAYRLGSLETKVFKRD